MRLVRQPSCWLDSASLMPRILRFSRHARDRMLDFHLDVSDIRTTLESSETVEEYEDGAQLVLGRSELQALHLVVRHSDEITFVITVYWPDPTRWDPSFRRRINI
jgi:hypothetical protein